MIKWAELTPMIAGNYLVSVADDDDNNPTPLLFDFEDDVIEEIEQMRESYRKQIKAGERKEGDEYQGEAHRVWFEDDRLFFIDDDNQPFEEIDWRAQL